MVWGLSFAEPVHGRGERRPAGERVRTGGVLSRSKVNPAEVAAAAPPTGRPPHPFDGSPAPVGRRAVARMVDFAVGVATFVGLTFSFALAAGRPEDGTGVLLISIVTTFVAYLLYEVILVAVWGRTLGKLLMGLRVVRAADSGRPGFGPSLLRNLVPTVLLVVAFPLYPLPYVAASVISGHRWPHDRLAGTHVVDCRSPRWSRELR